MPLYTTHTHAQPKHNYEYMKHSYLVSRSAYRHILELAIKERFVNSSRSQVLVFRGVSAFLNSIHLIPEFLPEDREYIGYCKNTQRHHDVHLNGEYRWSRKFNLSPDAIAHYRQLGLEWMLWQKQYSDTALVSGALEAFGNGKFDYELIEPKEYTTHKYHATYIHFKLTIPQLAWFDKQSRTAMYEKPFVRSFEAEFKGGRGFTNFLKDFHLLKFEPYPFDPNIEAPHVNVPPLFNELDEIVDVSWNTHPDLPRIFTRELWCPVFPHWPNELPTPLNPDTSYVESILQAK